MKELSLANTYINALKNVYSKQDILPIFEEIIELIDSIEKNSKVKELLDSPALSQTDKGNILNKIFAKGKITEKTQRFFHLLQKRNRLTILKEIRLKVREEILIMNNEIEIDIHTPMQLSEPDKKALLGYVQTFKNKKINATFQINESLLGGFKAYMDDTVIDGSIQNTLNKVRKNIQN